MKKIIQYISVFWASMLLLTGCLEETFPTSSIVVDQQIAGSDNGISALSNAVIASMTAGYRDYAMRCGYVSIMVSRDAMLEDVPVYDMGYNYFNTFATTDFLGDIQIFADIWNFHYDVINNANLLIHIVSPTEASPIALGNLGNALTYRAMMYMDLCRLYEFKHTGTSIDDASLHGLTVPIVTETTTEEEGRNNPRAPFYAMYRFILTDLNRAETYLENYSRSSKNTADRSVVYGLKARLWLEMGSRFTLYPADLSEMQAHASDKKLSAYDPLPVSSANDCYAKAAEYARKAIDAGGYSPLTKAEWFDEKNGFNTPNQAWLFAIIVGQNDPAASLRYWSFPGTMAQTEYGVFNSKYKAFRMIGKTLYDRIGEGDWRKATWIDPADAGKLPIPEKYKTNGLPSSEWIKYPAYTGFKFRPGQGDRESYQNGDVVSIPLMRVEEMYFIEAEALAYTSGISAGIQKLNDFMNTYRYEDHSYTCRATDITGFTEELLLQKRTEFWGEGILLWDYKRLEKQVVRGYTGTNFPENCRYNSIPGYVAPWMNLYITSLEYNYNTALVRNPDPSSAVPKWKK